MICVGTKRGVNYGVVYDASGRQIGRVFRHARVARKELGGGTQPFWTAEVALDGVRTSASLGTRHTTRRSALGAIRAFWALHNVELLSQSAKELGYSYERRNRGSRSKFLGYAAALDGLVNHFKSSYPEACALPTR